MKLTVRSESSQPQNTAGILYLVVFHLDNKELVKIGVTTRTIEERVVEILTSIFKCYREFPYCRPKRFRRTEAVYEKEAILHKFFEAFRYTPQHVFSGSTEFFDVPLDNIVMAYEQLLAGEPLDESLQKQVQNTG